jgi:hypothetical protein
LSVGTTIRALERDSSLASRQSNAPLEGGEGIHRVASDPVDGGPALGIHVNVKAEGWRLMAMPIRPIHPSMICTASRPLSHPEDERKQLEAKGRPPPRNGHWNPFTIFHP